VDEGIIRNLMIREAGEADLPRVLPLFAGLGLDNGRVLDADAARRLFERMRSYPDYRLYLAVLEGEVLGAFALLVMDNLGHLGAPSGVVEDVVVLEGWRGRGIGREMMRFAMNRCREKHCYKMVLSSNRRRVDAHRFYRSLGFREHGLSFEVDVT
jgi:GNAT superfamily N-acetyltransferase